MEFGVESMLAQGGLAFALTVGAVPLLRRLARELGVVKQPGPGHVHHQSIPEFGGPAIFAGWLVPLICLKMIPLGAALGAAAMLSLGVADDVLKMRAGRKLAFQIAIAVGYVLATRQLSFAIWPWAVALVTVFWLVAAANAFNLVDGLDGLAAGIGVIACSAIFAAATLHHNLPVAASSLALGMSLLAFLLYNFNPASIFMGDGGALAIGFLLGVLSLQIAGDAKNSAIAAYVFPLFLLMMPLLDTTIVTLTRLATGRAISARGLDHSHHRLLSLGLTHRSAVLLCWGVETLTAAYAIATTIMPHAYLIATLPMISAALAPYVLFLIDLSFDDRTPGVTYGRVGRLARVLLSLGYRMRVVDVALDAVMIAGSYFAVSILSLNFQVTDQTAARLLGGLPWVLVASCPGFFTVGVYRGIWRYVGVADVLRFGKGAALAGLLVLAAALARLIPMTPAGTVLFAILLFDLLVASRFSFRLMRRVLMAVAVPAKALLIIGAGRLGDAAARDIGTRTDRRVRVVGFVDEDVFTHGKLIAGLPVLGSIDRLADIYSDSKFDEIVIAAEAVDAKKLEKLRRFASERRLRLYHYSVQFSELDCDGVDREAGKLRDAPMTAASSADPGSDDLLAVTHVIATGRTG